MMYLSNATESGEMTQGCYDLEIFFDGEEEYYFMYKMIDYGYVVGHLNIDDKKEIDQICEKNNYNEFVKIVMLSKNQESGHLIFVRKDDCKKFAFKTDMEALKLNKS